MGYFLNIIIISGVFSILAVSLNTLSGFSGILSLAHAAFFGVGAYTLALLTTKLGMPYWVAFVSGGLFASFFGILIGLPTLRLKGDYLLIATLGFGEIYTNVMTNLDRVTEGTRGITNIPSPSLAGIRFDSDGTSLVLILIICVLCIICACLIKKSPFGKILFAISEDEDGASSLGRNTTKFKVTSIVFSAFWAGIAGAFYASYVGYINPNLFTINESILIFTMVLLGGLGSIPGSIIGAITLVALPEAMRFVGLPNTEAAVIRQMIYGLLLILIMYFRPQGLLGTVKLR
jgi:branched-chain amino acid transport system permease protein